MARVPTGIPASLVRSIRRLLSGSAGDVAWKLFVSAALLGLAYALALMGFIGAAIAGFILTTLLSDDIRQFVQDLWHRRFAEIKVPFL